MCDGTWTGIRFIRQTDRQTDVFPLTHSNAFLSGRGQITSEIAAWLALANIKCEMSFSVAILVHIQGWLNFILFTCCQLLAVLLQKPMPVMNTTKLPPIYLVLLESRKDKKSPPPLRSYASYSLSISNPMF